MKLSVDPKTLYYFVKVAEYRSFTRAAESLGLAQPNLSTKIGQLEHWLGTALFDRRRAPIELTTAGEQLLAESQALASGLEKADMVAEEMRREQNFTVRIGGSSSTVDLVHRQRLLDDFMRRFSGHRVVTLELTQTRGIEALERGEIDLFFGFFSGPLEREQFRSLLFEWSPLMLMIPRELDLAARRSLALSDLREAEVVGYPKTYLQSYNQIMVPIAANAAKVFYAPDSQPRAQVYYARSKRLILPLLGLLAKAYHVPEDMVLRPMAEKSLGMGFYLIGSKKPKNQAVRTFWQVAEEVCESS